MHMVSDEIGITSYRSIDLKEEGINGLWRENHLEAIKVL